jgi:hypothetical protein
MQADRAVDVQACPHIWLEPGKFSNRVRLTVDVDPVSFFERLGTHGPAPFAVGGGWPRRWAR